ncbi:MAG TPA: FixH family protein [Rhizomicrobium sp.]|nr:FixH family protein [Rhizomicrobium sp.]
MKSKLTGRGVLIWLVAFFGAIAAVDGTFIAASVSTYRGEDEQRPYLQGVEYNATLARRAAQRHNGWTARITLDRIGAAARIDVMLTDRQGRPQDAAGLAGEMRHPSDEHRDRPLRFRSQGRGRYEARVDGATRGAWDILVASNSAAMPFEASERLWLP